MLVSLVTPRNVAPCRWIGALGAYGVLQGLGVHAWAQGSSYYGLCKTCCANTRVVICRGAEQYHELAVVTAGESPVEKEFERKAPW